MEFAGPARKHYAEHGISDADALHVIRNPFRLIKQEGDYEGNPLITGVDRCVMAIINQDSVECQLDQRAVVLKGACRREGLELINECIE